MICPLLSFWALPLTPLPRPRFFPALLTLVTPFQISSAGTVTRNSLINYHIFRWKTYKHFVNMDVFRTVSMLGLYNWELTSVVEVGVWGDTAKRWADLAIKPSGLLTELIFNRGEMLQRHFAALRIPAISIYYLIKNYEIDMARKKRDANCRSKICLLAFWAVFFTVRCSSIALDKFIRKKK